MTSKSRWRTALAGSLFLHVLVLALAGATWTWHTIQTEKQKAKEPVYMEVTMADLLAPDNGLIELPGPAGGGGTPVGASGGTTEKSDSKLPIAQTAAGFSPTANPNAASPTGVETIPAGGRGEYGKGSGGGVGGGTGSGGGGTGGSGGGTGGGHGTGQGTGIGPGSGTGSGTTRGPRIVAGDKPEYPANARAKGWEGTVRLQILISVEGQVEDVRIVGSSGYAELDEAARRAIQEWRFRPALQNGSPVAAWATLPIVFDLR